MLKGIIFDFDGVVAESVQVKTDAFAYLYASHGKKIVSKVTEHHELNGGMSRFEKIKYYHKAYLGISLADDELKELADKFSKLVTKKVIESPYVPGAFEFIKQNYKKYKLFVSTGTPENEIIHILESKNINKYFNAIYGSPRSKTEHIKCIFNKFNFDAKDLLFIGDSTTDMDAASELNLKFVLRLHDINLDQFSSYNGWKMKDLSSLKNFLEKVF